MYGFNLKKEYRESLEESSTQNYFFWFLGKKRNQIFAE